LIDIDEIFRFLRRKPRVLFALFVMESMCWLQFTLSVMVTPRYLDTIAYLTITYEDDAEHLQEDLDKLAQWGEDWFMQFHPAK
jgi:hypothetical protein